MASWSNDNRSSYGGNRSGSGNGYSSGRGGASGGYSGGRNGSSGGYSHSPQKELPAEIVPQKVPEDYVDQAEAIMRSLMETGKTVTTSQIRKFLSLVNEIYNTENIRTEARLLPESVVKLNLMRVRVAYECGRDNTVKDFVAKTKLLEYLKGISTDRADLIRFAHYMEALVAYHRYFGGREV